MATYTPNYNLSKPDATDDFDAFRASYGDNMDKIDNNMGGGGGGGGHTIVDPTGADMPQENKLQFTGAVNVSDDSANGQTVVNVEGGGNVYGAFIDPTRVVYSSFVFDSSAHTWTATEDCILTDNMLPPDSTTAYFIRIGGKQVFAGYSTVEDPFVYVKKGQVIEYRAKSGSSLKAYGITQGTNGIYAPVIYSDNERVIGVWRDSKPLYQKTTHIGAISANVSSAFPVGIGANVVETMVSYNVIATVSSGAWVNLPQPLPSNVSNYASYVDNYNKADDTINIITGANRAFSDAFVTVQYTKTTDVAGSGNWNTDGIPMHHYSTNEQVIGTWIDGKPLYERTKVVPFANFTHNNDTYFTPIASDNTETLRKVEAIAYSTVYGVCTLGSRAYSRDNTLSYYWELVEYYSNVALHFVGESASDVGVTEVVITYQYTKTTD